MPEKAGNDRKWLEIAGNGWKWFDITRKGWEWMKLAILFGFSWLEIKKKKN